MKLPPLPVTRTAIVCLSLLATAPAPANEPEIITREQWGSKPQPLPDDARHTPKVLTVHHAGVLWRATDEPYARIRNLQSWGQRDKNWPDLPYHYLISPDGRIFEGRDVNYRPESNTNYDLRGTINVHLWGNFDEQRVSVQQLRSLVTLSAKLCRDLGLSPQEIRGHADAAPGQTSCPGRDLQRYISQGLLQTWTAAVLAGEPVAIEPLPELPGGPTAPIPTTRPAESP